MIPNFALAGLVLSRNHGLARFLHEWLAWTLIDQSPAESETEWSCVDVAGYKIIKVYKPPPSWLTPTATPTFSVCLYAGDFSYQQVNWGYSTTSFDGENPASWATANNLVLLQDPKGVARFSYYRWNVGTNSDLAFASVGQNNRLLDICVLGKFPRSRHRPSVIMPPKLKVPVYSDPVKRWNFPKADWKRFCFLPIKSVEGLLPPDTTNIDKAYQELCESLLFAAEQCIPLSRRKTYVPCWDKECETLDCSFLRTPVGTDSDRVASSLFSQLDDKKQERWEEAVTSIYFSHSSRKAWSTINKL